MQETTMIQDDLEIYVAQDSEEVHIKIRKMNKDYKKNGVILHFNKNKDLPSVQEGEPYRTIYLKDTL